MTDSGQVPLTPRWNYNRIVQLQERCEALEERLEQLELQLSVTSNDGFAVAITSEPEMSEDYVDTAIEAIAGSDAPLTKDGRPDRRYRRAAAE